MNILQVLHPHKRLVPWGLLVVLLGIAGCGMPWHSPKEAVPPATVKNPVEESRLTTITLTPEAAKRLGIELASIQYQGVADTLAVHGEVMAIPGHLSTVTAPWTGKLLPLNSLTAGTHVRQGQGLFRLVAITAEQTGLGMQQIDVDAKQKQVELVAAKVRRLEQLVVDKTVSERVVQEAKAELINAEAALDAALARQKFLQGRGGQTEAAAYSSMIIAAPFSGVVQKVTTAANQVVSGGTPLVDIAGVNTVWVRVPVYSGDKERVNMAFPAKVSVLGGDTVQTAHRVQGPATADPVAETSDLYYALTNTGEEFQIGERVSVRLNRKNSHAKRVVPYSAIVYDIDGGTWVYRKVDRNTYTRQRVSVSDVSGGKAILERGPDAGDQVVKTGAMELFGTEFGVGK